jgi:hypothetical protein
MNCHEINERLCEYWDLPLHDPSRQQVDEHIAFCSACKEEFEMWQESQHLIQSVRPAIAPEAIPHTISSGVMDRIYKDESWRMPIAFRSYSFSMAVRRNIMAFFSFFLAVFVVSFIYSFDTGTISEPDFSRYSGIVETAQVMSHDSVDRISIFADSAVASISAPSLLTIGPIQTTYTDYMLALSIIGVVITLLLMNWLSRLRV